MYISPFVNLSEVVLCSQVISLRPTKQNSQTLTGEQAILPHAVHSFTGELGKQAIGFRYFLRVASRKHPRKRQ